MNTELYLREFQAARDLVDAVRPAGLQIFTGVVLKSVVIKVYRPSWSNDPLHAVTARGRIFFSVWVNVGVMEEKRLYYNIHALKLREFRGYTIASRDFAERFRAAFVQYQQDWPNNSVRYGPLTLMQGWKTLEQNTLQHDVAGLVQQFFKIAPLIDNTLLHYRKE